MWCGNGNQCVVHALLFSCFLLLHSRSRIAKRKAKKAQTLPRSLSCGLIMNACELLSIRLLHTDVYTAAAFGASVDGKRYVTEGTNQTIILLFHLRRFLLLWGVMMFIANLCLPGGPMTTRISSHFRLHHLKCQPFLLGSCCCCFCGNKKRTFPVVENSHIRPRGRTWQEDVF